MLCEWGAKHEIPKVWAGKLYSTGAEQIKPRPHEPYISLVWP